MNQQRKAVYLNEKQWAFVKNDLEVGVFLAGRGTGKTTAGGPKIYRYIKEMPRSKGMVLGLTYNQILTKFLPPMIDMWEKLGLVEDIHYVIGKRPPKHFLSPYSPPRKFENVVSFFNGTCFEMISFDRKDLSRGGSYDWAWFDEAALIDKDRHDKELRPMVRGNIYRFNSPLHHQRNYVTSQAWLPSGEWVADMGTLGDPNIFYVESTAHDNVAVLGQKYLDSLERDLPYWTYQVEVLNRRLVKLPNGFYASLDPDRHTYVNTFLYSEGPRGIQSHGVSDYDASLPLEVSFDFGGSFCCMTVHQAHTHPDGKVEERLIDNFYVSRNLSTADQATGKSLIVQLVDRFCAKYAQHKSQVIIWGDRNGNNRQANSNMTYYDEILKLMRNYGIVCDKRVSGLDEYHAVKHFMINQILAETDPSLPTVRINKNSCKDLLISMQMAPVLADFKKDKSSERNQELPQERATHLSDCFDNYFTGKYGNRFGAHGAIAIDPFFT